MDHGIIYLCQSIEIGKMDVTAGDSSWNKLQISSSALGAVQYKGFHINYYEHLANKKSLAESDTNSTLDRYYFAPLVFLNHQRTTSLRNGASDEPELKLSYPNTRELT